MRLPRGFLQAWLDAFERSRIDNHGMVTNFVARLEREGAQRHAGAPASPSVAATYAMGAGWKSSPDARQSPWSLLKAAQREWRDLRRVRAGLGQTPRWVIADDRRTGCIRDRQRLLSLCKPFGGGQTPAALGLAPAEGQGLLCFTPNLLALRPEIPLPGVAHLGYLSLFVMPLLQPLAFGMACGRGLWSLRAGRWRNRHAWVTVLLAASIAALFKRHAPDGLTMLTSNSFVIELIRYMFLCTGQRGLAIEVLHGIPTRELEDYHAVLHAAFAAPLQGRLRFVPPVPGLQLTKHPAGSVVDGAAINLKFNDTADRRDLLQLARDSAARARQRGQPWVVALNGAGTVEGKAYTATGTFAMERAILGFVRQHAQDHQLPLHLQYSIHPAHVKSGMAQDIAAQLQGVEVLEDSFPTWLESDLCISIFSSASWEAHALGCAVVIGIRVDDAIYSEGLLADLAYPGPDESIFDVLARELARLPGRVRTGPEERIHRALPQAAPA